MGLNRIEIAKLVPLRRVVVLLALSLLLGTLTARCQPEPTETAFDRRAQEFARELERLRKQYRIPSLTCAIVYNNQVRYTGAFGYSVPEEKRRATVTTPYRIASLTKPMMSLLILELVRDDSLSLDDHIGEHLPNYAKLCGKFSRSSSYYYEDYCCQPGCYNPLRYHLSHRALGRPPGNEFMYNSPLYDLTLPVLENVAQQPYPERLKERIFWQAGMEQTAVCQCPEDSAGFAPLYANLAPPYQIDDITGALQRHPPPWPLEPSASAGIVSNVKDLARFDIALNTGQLIERQWLDSAWTPPITPEGDTLFYGLGWFTQWRHEPNLYWHYGWLLEGYSSLYLKVPDRELTLILLANGEGLSEEFLLWKGDVRTSPFADAFLHLFVDDPLPSWRKLIRMEPSLPDDWPQTREEEAAHRQALARAFGEYKPPVFQLFPPISPPGIAEPKQQIRRYLLPDISRLIWFIGRNTD